MHFTLVVPGLLDVAEADPAGVDGGSAAVAALLASAPTPATLDGIEAVVCTALGIARQRDWPIAAYLAAANLRPAAYWLLAQPVTLVVAGDDVRLDAVVDDLPGEDAAALVATLAAHFSAELDFFAPRPQRWLVAAHEPQRLDTEPVAAALGQSILPLLPAGPDAQRWRRWQSEMQMLLFEHPVNVARERAGRAPANGVWLSYGGSSGPAKPCAATLCTDDELLRDLARARGARVLPCPASFSAWRESHTDPASLVWLPAIDARQAKSALAAIDRDWAAPLAAVLNAGSIGGAGIVVGGRRRALVFAPRRRSWLARWRDRLASPRLSALLGNL
ncbi:MAG TPA: hypothetical protein VJQ49_12390 [Casimicrobiaceae bacterium]|nr:hypothetical protein [Casimicrobiaceae bacterium]